MLRSEAIAMIRAGRPNPHLAKESARRVDFWSRYYSTRPKSACYVLDDRKVRDVCYGVNAQLDGVIGLAWLEGKRWHGLIDDGTGFIAAGAHDDLEKCMDAIFTLREARLRSLRVEQMPTDPEGLLAVRIRLFDWTWFQSDDYDGARKRADEALRTIIALGTRIGLDRAREIFAENAPVGKDNPFEKGQESA